MSEVYVNKMKIVVSPNIMRRFLAGDEKIEIALNERDLRGICFLAPRMLLDKLGQEKDTLLSQGKVNENLLTARLSLVTSVVIPIPEESFQEAIPLARTLASNPENVECIALGLELNATGVWVGALPLIRIRKSLKGITTADLLTNFPPAPPLPEEESFEKPQKAQQVFAVEVGTEPMLTPIEKKIRIDPSLHIPVPYNPNTVLNPLQKVMNDLYVKAWNYLRTIGLPCIRFDAEGRREERVMTLEQLPRLFLAKQVQIIDVASPDEDEIGEGNATVVVKGLKRWRPDGSLLPEFSTESPEFPYGYAEHNYDFLYLFLGTYFKDPEEEYEDYTSDIIFNPISSPEQEEQDDEQHEEDESPQPEFKTEIIMTPKGIGLDEEQLAKIRILESLQSVSGDEIFRRFGLLRADLIPETWFYYVESNEKEINLRYSLIRVRDYCEYLSKIMNEAGTKIWEKKTE